MSSTYHHCNYSEESSPAHAGDLPAWATQSRALIAVIAGDLSITVVISSMTGNDSCFTAVATFCKEDISQKDAAQRAGEDDLYWVLIHLLRTVAKVRLPAPQATLGAAAEGRDGLSTTSTSVVSHEEATSVCAIHRLN